MGKANSETRLLMLAWNLEFILGIFIGAEETLGSIPILMDLSSLTNQHTSFSNGLYTFYNTPPMIGSVTAISNMLPSFIPSILSF